MPNWKITIWCPAAPEDTEVVGTYENCDLLHAFVSHCIYAVESRKAPKNDKYLAFHEMMNAREFLIEGVEQKLTGLPPGEEVFWEADEDDNTCYVIARA